jgi:hypothetical protein
MLQFIVCLTLLLHRPMPLLKATYTPVPKSDPEYAQGAIERIDVPHREIARFVWIIAVPEPGDWESRLNAALDSKDGPLHGSFSVTLPSAEEERDVAEGRIVLQH